MQFRIGSQLAWVGHHDVNRLASVCSSQKLLRHIRVWLYVDWSNCYPCVHSTCVLHSCVGGGVIANIACNLQIVRGEKCRSLSPSVLQDGSRNDIAVDKVSIVFAFPSRYTRSTITRPVFVEPSRRPGVVFIQMGSIVVCGAL